MQCVHFKCLQKWISDKIEVRDDEKILIYIWKELICELCKSKLKLIHTINNKSTHLIQTKCLKTSYILFESFWPDEQKKMYLFYVSIKEFEEVIVVNYFN